MSRTRDAHEDGLAAATHESAAVKRTGMHTITGVRFPNFRFETQSSLCQESVKAQNRLLTLWYVGLL